MFSVCFFKPGWPFQVPYTITTTHYLGHRILCIPKTVFTPGKYAAPAAKLAHRLLINHINNLYTLADTHLLLGDEKQLLLSTYYKSNSTFSANNRMNGKREEMFSFRCGREKTQWGQVEF